MVFSIFNIVVCIDFDKWGDRVSIIPYIEYIKEYTILFAFLKWRVYIEFTKKIDEK